MIKIREQVSELETFNHLEINFVAKVFKRQKFFILEKYIVDE